MIADKNRERKMVFYGRVSTEHEAQLSALENQMQWYDDQLKYHPNWQLCGRYIDQGITGTQAKKRPAFLKMMDDARAGKFDLIVTREVCRFARNTVDTLVATRELKNINVEVFFVEDNIWTLDGDGELRLTIMATLAQDESRKISERVKAGQQVSRMNKTLYGNGNILGYKRVGNTYVIDPEQAETVRMIYRWYLQGYGMRAIMGKLIENKRRCANGLIKWDTTKVSRVLHNATYMGYIGYNKSYRNNFLDQKIIRNKEDEFVYVKGDFEPIIPEDVWYACRDLRMDRSTTVPALVKSKQKRIGVTPTTDVWANKLRCACGSRFKRYKWRQDKDGQKHYGYSCYSRINNGSAEKRRQLDLDTDGFCDMPTVNETKLDVMAAVLFDNIIADKAPVIEEAVNILNQTLKEMKTENKRDLSDYQQRIEKAEKKLDSLLSMRADGEISKEEYQRAKSKCEQEIKELQAAMLGNGQEEGNAEESIDMQYVRDQLGKISITDSGKADKDVLMEFIDTITVEKGNVFRWGLWLRNKPSYLRMTTSGRSDNMTVSAVGAEFDAKECSDNPKTGQNGHFTPAGCDPHRRISRILASNLAYNMRGALCSAHIFYAQISRVLSTGICQIELCMRLGISHGRKNDLFG